jgi:hypothetical protein
MASIWASPRLAGDVAGGGPVQTVIREQAQFTRAGRDSGHWLEAVCHLVELLPCNCWWDRDRAGRATLIRASVDQLPPALDGPFDAILAVNSLGFWPAPAQRLTELRRRLAPGGRMAIASQPRCPGATADTTRSAARDIEDLLTDAGFTHLSTQTLPLSPPVACVLAASPVPDTSDTP